MFSMCIDCSIYVIIKRFYCTGVSCFYNYMFVVTKVFFKQFLEEKCKGEVFLKCHMRGRSSDDVRYVVKFVK